jgi:putative flippase GtrA
MDTPPPRSNAEPGPASRLRLPAAIARGIGRELLVFGLVGVVSTLAYAALYLLLRTVVGPVPANAAALLVTAVGNTAANRRLTFGVRDGTGMVRDQAVGLLALGVALAITTTAAGVLGAVAPRAPRVVELAVLVAANGLATVARFLLLRTGIAARHGALAQQPQETSA